MNWFTKANSCDLSVFLFRGETGAKSGSSCLHSGNGCKFLRQALVGRNLLFFQWSTKSYSCFFHSLPPPDICGCVVCASGWFPMRGKGGSTLARSHFRPR